MAFEITPESLQKAAGEASLAGITVLTIKGESLDNDAAMMIAKMCPNLVELDLSHNAIDDASGLSCLQKLTTLRLTNNKIASLAFATKLASLEQLQLQGNNIAHMREISALAGLKRLAILYLRNVDGTEGNPLTEHIAYRAAVIRQLEPLTNLDGGRTQLDEEGASAPPLGEMVKLCSDIPAEERWVPADYFDTTLTDPGVVLRDQFTAFGASHAECKKMESSAAAIIDRYKGFANIKGVAEK